MCPEPTLPHHALPALQAARADAQAHFRALLQELHLGPEARWRDYAERVKRDPQVSACASVSVLWWACAGPGCLHRLGLEWMAAISA